MDQKKKEAVLWILIPLVLHTSVLGLTQFLCDAAGWQIPGFPAVLANGLCIPLLWTIKKRFIPENAVVRQKDRRRDALFCLLCLLAGAALSWAASVCMEWAGIYRALPDDVLRELHSAPMWLRLTGLCLIVPLGEELVYRALVFDRMCGIFPVLVSACGSALVFALGHGNLLQAVYAFPMGLLLAGCYYRGGIAAAFLLHAGANLAAVFLQ